jgi:ABC-2 type transport system ATP-binding protein
VGNNEFVVLTGLTKDYGSFRALNNASITINEGEIFGYIGPNGAGKTTTMKILVGLINPSYGIATIGGYNVSKHKDETHKLLGYLPQSVAFQEWRTVNQTLKTFGKLSGLTDAKVEERIPEVLGLLGLADANSKKVSQLSGGMTQKLGLAQALLHNPKLLVLDEPLGGLDPLSRHQFKDIVLKLAHNCVTVLFSSHILSDVQDVADRVGIINHGRIMQVGTLNELKSRLTSKKTVEVQLSEASDKWQELKAISDVASVEQPSPNKVLVNLEPKADENQVINDIVQSIVRLGIRLRGIALLEPSLDEIYLKYVQEAENA